MKKNILAIGIAALFIGIVCIPGITSLKINKLYQPLPERPFGPIFFPFIDTNFDEDEGFYSDYKRRCLYIYFKPENVTNDKNYMKLRPFMGRDPIFERPYNDSRFAYQVFKISTLLFIGSAKTSNGRIIVNGIGILVTV